MNFMNDVMDLYVFDVNNHKIVEFKTLEKGSLALDKNDDGYLLRITDAAFNLELAKFLARYKVNEYENLVNGNDDMVLELGNLEELDCKLIATNSLIDGNENITNQLIYEMPVCSIKNHLSIETTCHNQITPFNYVFKIYPYSDNGNCFKLHIKK